MRVSLVKVYVALCGIEEKFSLYEKENLYDAINAIRDILSQEELNEAIKIIKEEKK